MAVKFGYNLKITIAVVNMKQAAGLRKVTEANSVVISEKGLIILWPLIKFVDFMQAKLMKKVVKAMLQCLK